MKASFLAMGVIALAGSAVAAPTPVAKDAAPRAVEHTENARQWDGDGTGPYTYFGDKKARQWDGDGTGPYTYFGDKKARQWDGDGTGPYTYFGDKKARESEAQA